MKTLGIILLVVGLLWLVIAFNTNTTVTTDGFTIGETYIPGREVHNIGLMDERRNHLMLSALVVLIGIILYVAGRGKGASKLTRSNEHLSQTADTRKCPYCAELVKVEAIICKHCQAKLPEVKPDILDPDKQKSDAMNALDKEREKRLMEGMSLGVQLSSDDVSFLKKRGISI